MNKLLLTIAILVATIGIADAHECSAPVAPQVFKQKFNHILAMHSDQHRLEDARAFVSGHCLLSRQVKQIAALFHDDKIRLKFAKSAYLTTFDKRNFYDVYDAFLHFSNAFRLHDYVLVQRVKGKQVDYNPRPKPKPNTTTHAFPTYDYPSIVGYNDQKYCDHPVGARMFNVLVGRVIRQPNDIDKIKTATKFGQVNCLTTSQIMKLGSMIESEQNRLILLRTSFDHVYDVMNYGYADQLFSSAAYHEKFQRFLTGGNSSTTTTTTTTTTVTKPSQPPCGTSTAQFEEIKQHIAGQSFNSTKITVAKQVIRAKECFTSRQIAEIVLLFAFEAGKLEMAKYAYDFCEDPANYFLVNNSLTFESSVKELTDFVASRQ
ncbi:MAG: DUF4476 domain-containing protein [Flavobacteriales bacterium]|nr:DUF4476 domain-containing protein [Flavobacteriales bacterium]